MYEKRRQILVAGLQRRRWQIESGNPLLNFTDSPERQGEYEDIMRRLREHGALGSEPAEIGTVISTDGTSSDVGTQGDGD